MDHRLERVIMDLRKVYIDEETPGYIKRSHLDEQLCLDDEELRQLKDSLGRFQTEKQDLVNKRSLAKMG